MLNGVVTVETEKGIPDGELEACVAVSTSADTAIKSMPDVKHPKMKEMQFESEYVKIHQINNSKVPEMYSEYLAMSRDIGSTGAALMGVCYMGSLRLKQRKEYQEEELKHA